MSPLATPEPPSLADLVTALERAANMSLKASVDSLRMAHETRELIARLHRLAALADTWSTEADEPTPGPSGLARTAALRMCARQLREELAKGGATP